MATAVEQTLSPFLVEVGFPDVQAWTAQFVLEVERMKTVSRRGRAAGKTIIGLGGGFSAGKSSLLNLMLGDRLLPTAVIPTTAVPTYLFRGEIEGVWALDGDREVELARSVLKDMRHRTEEEEGPVAHPQALFVQTPACPYEHLAFLDTPGYSKADAQNGSLATDEAIARQQLRSADRIFWLVDAAVGSLPSSDIQFLKMVATRAPILILVTKAEKLTDADLISVVERIREAATDEGLDVLQVLPVSRLGPEAEGLLMIRKWLAAWDQPPDSSPPEEALMLLVYEVRAYIEECIRQARRKLLRLAPAESADDVDLHQAVQRKRAEDAMCKGQRQLERLDALERQFLGLPPEWEQLRLTGLAATRIARSATGAPARDLALLFESPSFQTSPLPPVSRLVALKARLARESAAPMRSARLTLPILGHPKPARTRMNAMVSSPIEVPARLSTRLDGLDQDRPLPYIQCLSSLPVLPGRPCRLPDLGVPPRRRLLSKIVSDR